MTVGELANVVRFSVNQNDVNAVNNTINNIKNTAARLLGALGIGFSLKQLNAIAEEYNQISYRIAAAVDESENLYAVQEQILDAANRSRTAYGTFANEVTALTTADEKLFPVDDAIEFVENVNKLGKSLGYSDGEIASLQSNMQRFVSLGYATGADITRILKSTPQLAEQLAKGLGTDVDGLVRMAYAGRLTATEIKKAMVNSAQDIDKAYSKVSLSVSDALKTIRNRFGKFISDSDQALRVTETIGNSMVRAYDYLEKRLTEIRNRLVEIGDRLGGAQKLVRLIGITAGSITATLSGGKILSFLKTLVSTLGIGAGKLALIVGILVAIGLVIEDIIRFMNGDESLIGKVLNPEDAEKFKNAISELVGGNGLLDLISNALKGAEPIVTALATSLLPVIANLISASVPLISGILSKVGSYLPKIGQIIAQLAPTAGKLFGWLAQYIPTILQFISTLADVALPLLIGLLEMIMPMLEPILDIVGLIFDLSSAGLEGTRKGLEVLSKILTPIVEGIAAILKLTGALFSSSWQDTKDVFTGEYTVEKARARRQSAWSEFSDTLGNIVSGKTSTAVTSATAAMASTSTYNNRNVTQNVEINNTFNGDRAGQKQAANAMNQAAEDSTQYMANAIAFG